jgi:hypothetical protein
MKIVLIMGWIVWFRKILGCEFASRQTRDIGISEERRIEKVNGS